MAREREIRANNLDREQSYARAASDMPETTILSKRNLGPRPAAATRVETKLPRCVQRRLPCAPVPVRCHPRSSPYRCIDHRAPKRPYRLAVGLPVTRTGRGTPTSIPCSDRCPPGFRAIGTPHCKKSLSMMDLSLAVADPDGDFKSVCRTRTRDVNSRREMPREIRAD